MLLFLLSHDPAEVFIREFVAYIADQVFIIEGQSTVSVTFIQISKQLIKRIDVLGHFLNIQEVVEDYVLDFQIAVLQDLLEFSSREAVEELVKGGERVWLSLRLACLQRRVTGKVQ